MAAPPLFFCKCSFQGVYKRVSGSADSKGVSEWRRATSGFEEPSVAAQSLNIASRGFSSHPINRVAVH
jgi:hypothetical protein